MKLELTTNLVPFINVNMYETLLDSDNILDYEFNDVDMSDNEKENKYDTFNNVEYTKFIFDSSCKIFNDMYLPVLKTLGLDINDGKCVEIHSPKQYNYGGDDLYFDIYINNNLKEVWDNYKYIGNNEAEIMNFISKDSKSYDGFSSQMPHTLEDMDNYVDTDPERFIAAILRFELSKDENDYQTELLEIVEGDDKYNYDFFNLQVQEKLVLNFNNFIKRLK